MESAAVESAAVADRESVDASAPEVDPGDGDRGNGADGGDGGDDAAAGRVRAWVSPATSWALHLALAALAYIPQLFAQPGVASADTKSYLYLDPGTFLRQSASMWDPTVGLGTVTHEQIGYLLPMGPFFWVVHALGIPLWMGQRLWVGTILFVAGAGVLYLCRTMGVHGPGRLVAATAFMLSPYFLQYVGRISVILLPWAALPWLVALAARSVRVRGWRYPALFALVWLTSAASTPVRPSTPGWPRPCGFPTPCSSPRRPRGARRGRPRGGSPCSWSWCRCGGRGRPGGRGGLRAQHPQVHRDGPDGRHHLARLGGVPGPRLLVLLRRRRARAVGVDVDPVHPAAVADRPELRRSRPGLHGRRDRPLAGAGLLRPPRRGGDGPGGGRPPVHVGFVRGPRHQDVHDPDRPPAWRCAPPTGPRPP